jgi:hypothetical protein
MNGHLSNQNQALEKSFLGRINMTSYKGCIEGQVLLEF